MDESLQDHLPNVHTASTSGADAMMPSTPSRLFLAAEPVERRRQRSDANYPACRFCPVNGRQCCLHSSTATSVVNSITRTSTMEGEETRMQINPSIRCCIVLKSWTKLTTCSCFPAHGPDTATQPSPRAKERQEGKENGKGACGGLEVMPLNDRPYSRRIRSTCLPASSTNATSSTTAPTSPTEALQRAGPVVGLSNAKGAMITEAAALQQHRPSQDRAFGLVVRCPTSPSNRSGTLAEFTTSTIQEMSLIRYWV